MRRKLAKKYVDEGYKIDEWTSRKDAHAADRYEIRARNVDKLKAAYGKDYDPYWDKGLRPQKMDDAVRTRVPTAASGGEDHRRSYDDYFDGRTDDGENARPNVAGTVFFFLIIRYRS